jgi:hypothetical protein
MSTLVAGSYQARGGGFYGGGTNARPQAHEALGQAIVNSIVPLNTSGVRDDANGKYLMVGLGLSHTTGEVAALQTGYTSGTFIKNSKFHFADGALGGPPYGGTSQRMVDANNGYWAASKTKMQTEGVEPIQVQFAWLKTTYQGPAGHGLSFPDSIEQLATDFLNICRNIKTHYVNVKVVYISSRSYGGWSDGNASPEPWAYEDAFAVKMAVHRQVVGRLDGPNATTPYVCWGPYFWSPTLLDCATQFGDDFLHPNTAGYAVIAAVMHGWFADDSILRRFYHP